MQTSLLSRLVLLGGGFCATTSVFAAPPLIQAQEVVGRNLVVYVQQGAILITEAPTQTTTPTPAVRPLEAPTPTPLPADLSQWTPLRADDCAAPPTFRWARGQQTAVAKTIGDWTSPGLSVTIDGTTVATALLGHPAYICTLHVRDVDANPGEEVVAIWRTQKEDGATEGVTVFHIPETAH